MSSLAEEFEEELEVEDTRFISVSDTEEKEELEEEFIESGNDLSVEFDSVVSNIYSVTRSKYPDGGKFRRFLRLNIITVYEEIPHIIMDYIQCIKTHFPSSFTRVNNQHINRTILNNGFQHIGNIYHDHCIFQHNLDIELPYREEHMIRREYQRTIIVSDTYKCDFSWLLFIHTTFMNLVLPFKEELRESVDLGSYGNYIICPFVLQNTSLLTFDATFKNQISKQMIQDLFNSCPYSQNLMQSLLWDSTIREDQKKYAVWAALRERYIRSPEDIYSLNIQNRGRFQLFNSIPDDKYILNQEYHLTLNTKYRIIKRKESFPFSSSSVNMFSSNLSTGKKVTMIQLLKLNGAKQPDSDVYLCWDAYQNTEVQYPGLVSHPYPETISPKLQGVKWSPYFFSTGFELYNKLESIHHKCIPSHPRHNGAYVVENSTAGTLIVVTKCTLNKVKRIIEQHGKSSWKIGIYGGTPKKRKQFNPSLYDIVLTTDTILKQDACTLFPSAKETWEQQQNGTTLQIPRESPLFIPEETEEYRPHRFILSNEQDILSNIKDFLFYDPIAGPYVLNQDEINTIQSKCEKFNCENQYLRWYARSSVQPRPSRYIRRVPVLFSKMDNLINTLDLTGNSLETGVFYKTIRVPIDQFNFVDQQTSYNMRFRNECPLMNVAWWRVVLDSSVSLNTKTKFGNSIKMLVRRNTLFLSHKISNPSSVLKLCSPPGSEECWIKHFNINQIHNISISSTLWGLHPYQIPSPQIHLQRLQFKNSKITDMICLSSIILNMIISYFNGENKLIEQFQYMENANKFRINQYIDDVIRWMLSKIKNYYYREEETLLNFLYERCIHMKIHEYRDIQNCFKRSFPDTMNPSIAKGSPVSRVHGVLPQHPQNLIRPSDLCVFCLEKSTREGVLAPCGHVFCLGCIEQWKNARVSQELSVLNCPVCREEVITYHEIINTIEKEEENFMVETNPKFSWIIEHLPTLKKAVLVTETPWQAKAVAQTINGEGGYAHYLDDDVYPSLIYSSAIDSFRESEPDSQHILVLTYDTMDRGEDFSFVQSLILWDIPLSPLSIYNCVICFQKEGRKHPIHVYPLVYAGGIQDGSWKEVCHIIKNPFSLSSKPVANIKKTCILKHIKDAAWKQIRKSESSLF